MILNKIDKLSDEEILKKIDEYKNLYEFAEIIPVSALKNDNIDRLIKELEETIIEAKEKIENNKLGEK